MYRDGRVLGVDIREAMRWLERAASLANTAARAALDDLWLSISINHTQI
jgi:TPR repeat protein